MSEQNENMNEEPFKGNLDKVMDAINQGKQGLNDIIELVRLYPDEFLTALRASIEALKGIIKNAESVQTENLQGLTDIQKETIKSISDSLMSVEDILRLLATQSQSDEIRLKIAKLTIKVAKYKMKTIQAINKKNNETRKEIQQEINRFWEALAGIGTGIVGLVLIIISRNNRD